MLRHSTLSRRAALPPIRQRAGIHALSARSIFPLIRRGNLLPQFVRHFIDYQTFRCTHFG
jgi:hypothetical protein